MFYDTEGPDHACATLEAPEASPAARALAETLAGCCHPRAERLAARLLACDQPEQLPLLRGEVLNLLALSFGTAEAQRRLRALQ